VPADPSTDKKKRNSLHHQAQGAHFLEAIASDILKKQNVLDETKIKIK
jgi:hypothetical protein